MPSLMEKGWRESADKTPQHKYDIRLTDFFTPIIVGALQDFAKSLPIESVVAMFSHDNVKDVDKKKLRQQIVATLGNGDSEKLLNVMLDLYAASYSAGKHAGDEQFADSKIVKASYDWSAWEPGDIQASNALIDGGLKSLWGGANIVVSGLNDTTVDRIGNRIADGLMLGLPGGDIADSIYDLVGDPRRAEMIAHTESTRGMQAGTLESYNSNGVGRWELLPADGACEECLALVGQEFPASDLNDMPPIHPWCRCSTIPVIDSIAFDELGNPAGITGGGIGSSENNAEIFSNYVLSDYKSLPSIAQPDPQEYNAHVSNIAAAARSYAGEGYRKMNGPLRNFGGYSETADYGSLTKQITDLRNGLMEQTLSEDTVVSRGMGYGSEFFGHLLDEGVTLGQHADLPEGIAERAIGTSFTNNSFMSTFTKLNDGIESNASYANSYYKVDLYLPAGTHGATIGNAFESEFVLPPGNTITIVDVTRDEKGKYLVKAVLTEVAK